MQEYVKIENYTEIMSFSETKSWKIQNSEENSEILSRWELCSMSASDCPSLQAEQLKTCRALLTMPSFPAAVLSVAEAGSQL